MVPSTIFTNQPLRKEDNVQLESLSVSQKPKMRFRRRNLKAKKTSVDPKALVVSVEATQITSLDSHIRKGRLSDIEPPFVAGSNFVGLVHQGSLRKGTRVAGITRTGSNAKYVNTSVDKVIQVPRSLDSGELASMLASYLPAFQALHHGHDKQRYAKSSFKRQKILIGPGAKLVDIEAMIKIAQLKGAKEVCVVCEYEKHRYVRRMGAAALDVGTDSWQRKVKGRMDLVVECDYGENRDALRAARKVTGRFVSIQHPNNARNLMSFMDQAWFAMSERFYIYDFLQSWDDSVDVAKVRFDPFRSLALYTYQL